VLASMRVSAQAVPPPSWALASRRATSGVALGRATTCDRGDDVAQHDAEAARRVISPEERRDGGRERWLAEAAQRQRQPIP